MKNILQKIIKVQQKLNNKQSDLKNIANKLPSDSQILGLNSRLDKIEQRISGAISEDSMTMSLYKCASVDTTNKTWTGMKLILQDGVYVVSGTETTGLAYSGFTPSVGTMYNEDATFIISYLFTKSDTLEGCVFAANMQSNAAVYNGETINLDGITLADAPGYTDGTKALASDINMPFDGANIFADGNCTVAFSAYFITKADGSPTFVKMIDGEGNDHIYSYQQYSAGKMYSNICSSIGFAFNSGFYDCGSFGWHHIVLQNKGNEFGKFFVDGVLIATDTSTSGYDAISQIKSISSLATILRSARMKDLQIYNRVLSEDEIMLLYEKAKLPTA